MDFNLYKKIHGEFLTLINVSESLAEVRVGEKVNNASEGYGERIFIKLICHAKTLLNLSPSVAPLARELWDVSSCYAVARALIETFDSLFYILLDDISNSEKDFRLSYWRAHSESRRIKMLNFISSGNGQLRDVEKELAELNLLLLNHEFFESLPKEVKAKLRARQYLPFYLSKKVRCERAGVNYEYYQACTMHLSTHIHTHPFSVYQLVDFDTRDPECLGLMSISLQYASAFMAKAIIGYSEFLGKKAPPFSSDIINLLELWCGVAKRGVRFTC